MTVDTVVNKTFNKAPRRTVLFGDKSKKIESSTHIIEFPGGAVEVSRTTDGNYWAHIIVNRGFGGGDCDGLSSAVGEVVGSRLDCGTGEIPNIPGHDTLTQVAVLIKPVRP